VVALLRPPPRAAAGGGAGVAVGGGGAGGGGGGGGGASGGEGVGRSEDAPVRAGSTGPRFGSLALHAGVELGSVRACLVKLAAMFRSRVKTIPQALLRAYTLKAAEAQAALDAVKEAR